MKQPGADQYSEQQDVPFSGSVFFISMEEHNYCRDNRRYPCAQLIRHARIPRRESHSLQGDRIPEHRDSGRIRRLVTDNTA